MTRVTTVDRLTGVPIQTDVVNVFTGSQNPGPITAGAPPSDGQVLIWNTAQQTWLPGAGGGGAVVAVTPTLRGSTFATFSAATVNAVLPASCVAGDLALVWCTNGVPFGSLLPAGCTKLAVNDGGYPNQLTFAKVLTAGDITTGYITVPQGGGYDGVVACAVVIGTTVKNIHDHIEFASANNSYATFSLTGLLQADPTDLILGFTYCRGNAVVGITNSTQLGIGQIANAAGFLGKLTNPPGKLGVNETANYSAGNNGITFSLVAIK